MVSSIQYEEHTADIRMAVKAPTLETLFAAALKGMGNLIKQGLCDQTDVFPVEKHLEISSFDTTALLIDFLSEVLTICYIEHVVFCQVMFKQLDAGKLQVIISGQAVAGFDEDIKAVTYHEAEVVHRNDHWESTIIFDI